MKRYLLLFLSLFVIPVFAALGSDCPSIVQQAMTSTKDVCDSTTRNQACYGYMTLSAQPQADVQHFTFGSPGDKVNVNDIASLRLSPMDVGKGVWGIALMRLQASLPASDNHNITLLTFGDVQLQNAVQPETTLEVTALNAANVRRYPTTTAPVIASLARSQTVQAVERLADNSWLAVDLPDSSEPGWVSASLLQIVGDVNTLMIGDAQKPAFRPMQAFYFQSGTDSSSGGCAQVPPSGLMIQTPEGAAEVRLWINEVRVDFGSTVFFQAQPGGAMTITTVEGHARVEAMGLAQTAFAGSSVQVPLGADMKPTAPPTVPVAYNADDLQDLPIDLLERPITIHTGLTPDELQQAQQSASGASNGANVNDCPGNSCHDGACPGNSCHDNTCPGQSCESHGNSNNNGNGNGNGNGNNNGNGKGNGHGG